MNKSHRDIKPESIFGKETLRERIKELSNENLEPVHIEPKIEPQGFWENAKARVLDSIIPFIREMISFEFYLNWKEFASGKSEHLRIELLVFIAGRKIIGREVKLI